MQWTAEDDINGGYELAGVFGGLASDTLAEAIAEWIAHEEWIHGECGVCGSERRYCKASGVYQVER